MPQPTDRITNLSENLKGVKERVTHITALDGIRGIAILMVLVDHLLDGSDRSRSLLLNIVLNVRASGWAGVDVFFALSGFLITGILYDSLGDRRYFRNFYGRRVLRIFPLYYGVLLIVLVGLLLAHVATAANLHLLATNVVYLQNTALFLHPVVAGHAVAGPQAAGPYLSHLWSLAVEEQFYLVWPVLIFLVRDRARLCWIALGLACLAPAFRFYLLAHGAGDDVYFYTFCRQDSLLLGAWLALSIRGTAQARARISRFALYPFLLGLAVMVAIAIKTGNFSHVGNLDINQYGYTAISVAGTSLIAMALAAGSLTQRLMNAGFLRFFGKYSYGLYVLHPLVWFGVVNPLEARAFWPHPHSAYLQHLLHFAAVMALAIPLAMLSYQFYEKPFLKLKRYFNYDR